jgi:hypothetical protein
MFIITGGNISRGEKYAYEYVDFLAPKSASRSTYSGETWVDPPSVKIG